MCLTLKMYISGTEIGACHQTQEPEANSSELTQWKERGNTLKVPLTPTCVLWHMHAYTHTQNTNVKIHYKLSHLVMEWSHKNCL